MKRLAAATEGKREEEEEENGEVEGGRNTFTLTDTATGRESRIPDSKKL